MKGGTGFIEKCAPYILSGICLRPAGRSVIGSTGSSLAQFTVGTPQRHTSGVRTFAGSTPHGERPSARLQSRLSAHAVAAHLLATRRGAKPHQLPRQRQRHLSSITHAAARRTAVRTLGRHALWFDARMRSSIGRCNTTCRRATSAATKTATHRRARSK